MPVAHRSASSNASSSTTSLSVTAPSGIVDGDWLYGVVAWRDTVTLTPPSGFSQVHDQDAYDGQNRFRVYRKKAAGESGSYAWGLSSAQRISVGMIAVSGADQTEPVDVATAGNSGSSSSPQAQALDPTVPNTLLVFFGTSRATSWTPPSGMTERVDVDGGVSVHIATEDYAPDTSTGTRTASTSNFSWATYMVALKPALGAINPLMLSFP